MELELAIIELSIQLQGDLLSSHLISWLIILQTVLDVFSSNLIGFAILRQ